ncbi:hypothetical protein R3P38DRAFT_2982989 [Favolaschia claudopus]|uniref:Uncharacterized protein n=1 Tax=Favolaschia claudopus TaxID=2862362 RepID=A0AAW0AYV9_9AGAR
MAQTPSSSTDTNSIRASVYDVFLELGALDANSRVAQWIFTDPSCVLPDPDEVDEVAWRPPRETVKFAEGSDRGHGLPQNSGAAEAANLISRPPSSSRTFGFNKFSPKRSKSRSSKRKSSSSSSPIISPSGDGYDTDEGYQSVSGTPKKSRVRAVFSLQSSKSSETSTVASTKPLPTLPPIRERLTITRTVSSVFKKRSKSPPPAETERDIQQWHEVSALSPRIYNPSADNGIALAPPAPSSFRQIPAGPSSFRQILAAAAETGEGEATTFALPRTLFPSMSLKTKRRVTSKARPQSLDLESNSTRHATSLPSSPFILVTEGENNPTPGPQTPFVFVSTVDNPTPRSRRFSDVTSMTAPLAVYPLSISKTLRRSMVFDKVQDTLEPSFPGLRRSSSCSSMIAALAASTSAVSPYELYNQPIPIIRRGKESPFPARPVLPQPLSASVPGESRMATIQRYREFSEQLVELTPYKRFMQQM